MKLTSTYVYVILFALLLEGCGDPLQVDTRYSVPSEFDQKVQENAPAFLLDANGLKVRFQDVFGKELPRGESWLAALKKRVNGFKYQGEYFAFHNETMFSPEEEAAFGTYQIWANRSSPTSTSRLQTKRLNGLTQAYMRGLRAFLADACRNQFAKESNGASDRLLVPSESRAPKLLEVNTFMSRMFGFPSGVIPHEGATEYQAILEEGFQQKVDLETLYVSYCIAVGQDQRTFVR